MIVNPVPNQDLPVTRNSESLSQDSEMENAVRPLSLEPVSCDATMEPPQAGSNDLQRSDTLPVKSHAPTTSQPGRILKSSPTWPTPVSSASKQQPGQSKGPVYMMETLNQVSRGTSLPKHGTQSLSAAELESMTHSEIVQYTEQLQNQLNRLRTKVMFQDSTSVTVKDHSQHSATNVQSPGANDQSQPATVIGQSQIAPASSHSQAVAGSIDHSRSSPNTPGLSSQQINTPESGDSKSRNSRAAIPPNHKHGEKRKAPSKPTRLHPNIFDVHTGRAVKKQWLGRSASIMTQTALNQTSKQTKNDHDHRDPTVVLSQLFHYFSNEQFQQYLKTKEFARNLCEIFEKVTRVFATEERVLHVPSPCYVLGDLHGNLEDLYFFSENVWPLGMSLTAGKFVFLGDYVDRGAYPLEVLAYLFAQKVLYPDKVFLIRGNHETRSVNGWVEFYQSGSFLFQCQQRFGEEVGNYVWEAANVAFDHMPLACIIDNSIFAVHGGIPFPCVDENGKDVRIDKMQQIPCPLPLSENTESSDELTNLAQTLMWADPASVHQESTLDKKSGFGESARGGGTVVFGNKAIGDFLEQYSFSFILRAHEATADGVSVSKGARVLTIFSTSKDHGQGGSAKCGCVLVDNNNIKAITRGVNYTHSGKHHKRSEQSKVQQRHKVYREIPSTSNSQNRTSQEQHKLETQQQHSTQQSHDQHHSTQQSHDQHHSTQQSHEQHHHNKHHSTQQPKNQHHSTQQNQHHATQQPHNQHHATQQNQPPRQQHCEGRPRSHSMVVDEERKSDQKGERMVDPMSNPVAEVPSVLTPNITQETIVESQHEEDEYDDDDDLPATQPV